MAGIRLTPEESDVASQGRSTAASDLISDDDRSVAADSWSIKSDYGSTLDDDQRHADATEALAAAATFPPPPSDYRLTPEESDVASQGGGTTASDLISDDDRSVAADSWSIKNDYGSTLDDDQRHADATEALAAAATFPPPPSDYRLTPEESDVASQGGGTTASDLISDDDRSVAADSWSIKNDYGSTLDDDQRHADATEALADAATFPPPPSDYSSDKEESDADAVTSMLGFQSYWDSAYADELTNFREHGHVGEIWFGPDVMETVASWTKGLCRGPLTNHIGEQKSGTNEQTDKNLSSWSVLDLGTGNGLLLQELARQGFSNLTGTDYIEGAINLARSLAERDGFTNIKFLVDDVLETKLDGSYKLVMDKGTLDAIGLHPDGPIKRIMYWESVSKLVAPGGILVVTSCNNTKDELVQEVENFNRRSISISQEDGPHFHYLDHIRSYPTFMFGGAVGSRVATVAFLRN